MTNKKELLLAVIATFITFCAWVLFDIIHTRSQVEIPSDLKETIEPVSPDFKTDLVEKNL